MRKQLLIFIAFLSISDLYAQDIFSHAGKNITRYDFVTNQPVSPTPPDYRVGMGNFYEIGFSPKHSVKKGPIQNVTYLVSLTYNEFNAEASKDLNSYAWKTSYLGLQNVIEYAFFEARTGIKLSLNAGLKSNYQDLVVKGIKIVSIAADTDHNTYKTTAASFPWKAKYCDGQGMNGINFKNYAVMGTPTMFLLDSKGIIIEKIATVEQLMKLQVEESNRKE